MNIGNTYRPMWFKGQRRIPVAAAHRRARGSIEQTKGMLMLVYGFTADRAFDLLVRLDRVAPW
ncbi:ANTAR domain-containing protein [Rhodococcus baikonurensis]|uniref:ANTAR domain-containing protein n=1 Tax=Rhodococcus erythropolis group TaxID=2840174 RepID=UPI00117BB0B6|nr:ANTAR domain protein [Rhodococcus erythropolis]